MMSYFGWADYTVFGGMLVVSSAIGVYQGNAARGGSAIQFLTGGGQMATFPVALSMLASFLSSITLMGQPAEVYLYGAQQWLFGIASFIIVPVVGYVMVPFFRERNYFSAYQYFGERFSRKLQLLASCLFTFQMVLYLSLVLYAPALAMHQVTGLNTLMLVTIMYVVCIVYTTIGGMKAVIWTDTFQVVVLFVSLGAVLTKGTMDIGGTKVVWERSQQFNRTTFFNWNYDMTERYTFWSSLIGSGFLHISTYGGNQLQIQRYLTVKSTKDARRMLWINAIGWALVMFLCVYAGLLIFAAYAYCDPLRTQKISKPDQLFPLFVMETLYTYPGFPGLFICGIFSAGLSTVSTGVNSLAAIWFAELEGTQFRKKLTDSQTGLVVKGLALTFGILSYLVVFIVPFMGGLVPLAVSLSSIFAGSLFGLFMLGMMSNKTNALGSATGLITSVVFLCWISSGASWAQKHGQIVHLPQPSSLAGCATPVEEKVKHGGEYAFLLYRISYTWYCLIATFTTIIVGFAASYLVNWLTPRSRVQETLTQNDLNINNLLLNEKELKVVTIQNKGAR
ncbi:sodium-coupled monocarboxylate transporter 1-like isoform X2 [Rhodnius prolixus]|uniref:sodium-coupled monocarboxylate transporter 1-like isoform X2 n=1 Tax=Rhodnius prolixus TaxID=13249 RepID=UPI003D18A863